MQACPCCNRKLELKQINFEEAVYICTDLKCPYPLDRAKILIYKQKLRVAVKKDLPLLKVDDEREIKRKNTLDNYSQGSQISSKAQNAMSFKEKYYQDVLIKVKDSNVCEVLTKNETQTSSKASWMNFSTESDGAISRSRNILTNISVGKGDKKTHYQNNDTLKIELKIDPLSNKPLTKNLNDMDTNGRIGNAGFSSPVRDQKKPSDNIVQSDQDQNKVKLELSFGSDVEELIDAKINELLEDDIDSTSLDIFDECTDWFTGLLDV